MAMTFSNTGEVVALNYLVNKTAPENLIYKLFANNITPAETDTAAAYTEAAGGGYASQTLSGANWTVSGGAPSSASHAQITYTFTGPLTTNTTVYGYYVVTATGGTLVMSETFTSFTPAASGDNIKITPTITAE